MAERIAGLAFRPRRSTRVGAPNASAIPCALAPDLSGRPAAGLGGRFLFRSGPPASDSDGGLFETVDGEAEARGDWGMPQRRRARRAAAVAAILAGASAVVPSRASRAANAGPR